MATLCCSRTRTSDWRSSTRASLSTARIAKCDVNFEVQLSYHRLQPRAASVSASTADPATITAPHQVRLNTHGGRVRVFHKLKTAERFWHTNRSDPSMCDSCGERRAHRRSHSVHVGTPAVARDSLSGHSRSRIRCVRKRSHADTSRAYLSLTRHRCSFVPARCVRTWAQPVGLAMMLVRNLHKQPSS